MSSPGRGKHFLAREDVKDDDLVAQLVWSCIHGLVSLELIKGEHKWIPWRPLPKRFAAGEIGKAYRDAREALRKEEHELLDKVKAVAARRRTLPPGGELKDGIQPLATPPARHWRASA